MTIAIKPYLALYYRLIVFTSVYSFSDGRLRGPCPISSAPDPLDSVKTGLNGVAFGPFVAFYISSVIKYRSLLLCTIWFIDYYTGWPKKSKPL